MGGVPNGAHAGVQRRPRWVVPDDLGGEGVDRVGRLFRGGQRRSGGDDRSRGAVMVEFAILVPVLLLIMMGIIEFALAFKDDAAVSSSVRVGARIASAGAGSGPTACPNYSGSGSTPCPALAQAAADAIRVAGVAMPKDSIDWIWVYRVLPGENGNAPTTCTTNCIQFKWRDSLDRFGYNGGTWNQSTINACLNAPEAQSVGVYMQATHMNVTRFFGTSFRLTDRAVMKFEPLPAQMCNGLGPGLGGHQ